MGISIGNTGNTNMSDINMTPMIDVLLVLLVIFMIAQPLLQKGIDVQLPLNEKTDTPASNQIVLEIDKNGIYRINTRTVSKENLESELRRIYSGRPDKVMFVKADGEVIYQDVITAMDAARGAGVKVLGSVLD